MKPALLLLLGMCASVSVAHAGSAPPPASYLEIPGVTGPVNAPDLSGAFNVDAFSFGTATCGHVACSSVDVLIPSAEVSPLIHAANTGEHFSVVYIDNFAYTSNTTASILKDTLGGVLIAGISSNSGGLRDDKIVFDYTKISISSGSCGHNGVACPPPRSVPEPATLALLSFGLFGLGLSRRKRAA